MKLASFSGCLGGTPKKARYLTGRYGEEISYLDPHYVETEVDRMNLKKEMDKFHCKEYLLMAREDLDTDIAICFLIRDFSDLNILLNTLDNLNKRHRWRLIQTSLYDDEYMDVEEDVVSQLDDYDNRS